MKLSRIRAELKGTTVSGLLCWFIAIFCLALSLYFSFEADSHGHKMLADMLGQRDAVATNPHFKIDTIFRSLTEDGNVFVWFRDFNADDFKQIAFMTRIYYRGSYVAYPARLYVSSGGTVINNGRDIWRVNHEPDENVTRLNGISKIVIFEFDARNGQLKSRIQSSVK